MKSIQSMIQKSLAFLVTWLFAMVLPVGAQTDFIGLYLTWQRDPTTTMTVNWVNLYEEGTVTVWHRVQGTEKWFSKSGKRHQARPSVFQVRRVELTGLKPETTYEFALGDEAPSEPKGIYKFRTMPAELKRPVRFVNGGDMMHSRELMDAMNRQAAKLDPDFAYLGGDLAYENGSNVSRYCDWFQSWTSGMRGKDGRLIPFVTGIGNHEVKGHYGGRIPDDAPYFYGFFALPEGRSYYSLDFGRYLSLVVLDSGHTQPISGKQTQWLASTLAARAQQQFLFAGYHWPVYGTAKAQPGLLPCDSPRSQEMRTNWVSQFERHGVSVIFEHDHHTYKRTHRLRNHQRDDENGLLFLGDGAWGVNTRDPVSPDKAWYLAKSEARRHLFSVTLHPEGRFYVEAVDANGTVFDRVEALSPRTKPMAN